MSIEIKDIRKSFRSTKALDGVTCSFEEGHIIGLLGRNGAGKSTLLKCLGDRITPDGGSIEIDGEKHTSPRAFAAMTLVGDENMLPSSTKLMDIYRMMDDMGVGSYEKAMMLSRKFKLNPKKKWEKLSTGYTTIFKDIMALSSNRSYVFFDEPILGLDANHRELFYQELLSAFTPERCFVVATHLIEEISPLVDKVIIIDGGKLIVEEDKDTLLSGLSMVSGEKEKVMAAIEGKKILSSSSILGQTRVMVEGKVEDTTVTVEGVDLQRYFVEITKERE